MTKQQLDTLIIKINKLYKEENYKEIDKTLTDTLLNKYDNEELYVLKSKALAWLREHESSFKYANLAIKKNPLYGSAYRLRGNYYREMKNYSISLIEYSKAIELNPNDDIAYANRGGLYHRMKNLDKALEDYTKSVALNPSDYIAIGNRGAVWLDLGNHEEAIKDITKSIEINPKNPISYYALSEAYKMKGDFQKALKTIKQAIVLNPKNAFYYSFLGDINFELKSYPAALTAYEDAVRLNSKNKYFISLRDKAKARLGEEVFIDKDTNNITDNTENTANYIETLLLGIQELDKKSIRMAWAAIEDTIDRIRKLLIYTGNDPVVHYTRIQVSDIMAMNKDFKLRYSNVVFMNDPEEGAVFLEHLNDSTIINSFKCGNKKDDNNIYLGSFLPEEKIDYLIMWRTYGKNNQNEEATGCSFLIKSDFFSRDGGSLYLEAGKVSSSKEKELEKDLLHSQPLYKVVYFNRETKQLINDGQYDLIKLTKEIENFKENIKKLISLKEPVANNVEPKNEIIDDLVYRFISELRYFFKSAEYQFEKELRVIKYYPMESPKVLVDKDTSELPRKLYIESTKTLQPFLSRLTLGPKVVHPERYMYLEALLKKNGYSNIELKRSDKNYQ